MWKKYSIALAVFGVVLVAWTANAGEEIVEVAVVDCTDQSARSQEFKERPIALMTEGDESWCWLPDPAELVKREVETARYIVRHLGDVEVDNLVPDAETALREKGLAWLMYRFKANVGLEKKYMDALKQALEKAKKKKPQPPVPPKD